MITQKTPTSAELQIKQMQQETHVFQSLSGALLPSAHLEGTQEL